MPRIFLSHSSVDDREATALKKWLATQDPSLKNQMFLDTGREAGMVGGEKWRATLRRNLASCQALLCLISKNWDASKECHAEFVDADGKGKTIFCARLDSNAGLDHEIAAFQRWDLFVGDGRPTTEIDIGDGKAPVLFSTEGLERLLRDVRSPDLGADSFAWPPPDEVNREPYRGLFPYESDDAAVYFGRETELGGAINKLEAMHEDTRFGLFVILGPSGTGKSSFLRAGILPRLDVRRDQFTVLDIVRPGRREALSGDMGFANAIFETRKRLGLRAPALGDIRTRLIHDAAKIRQLLIECQRVAAEDVEDLGGSTTLVLPLDQAEELFSAEGGQEALEMLGLIRDLLTAANDAPDGPRLRLIIAATIRTDRYAAMQTAEELSGVHTELFNDLKPMRQSRFRQVIEGPARRSTEGGRPITVQHELVDRLLDDAAAKATPEGGDALPLLSGTLGRLFRDYGDSGELTVEQYEQIGGIGGVVETEINDILSLDPAVRTTELARLKEAFIPWLATVSDKNEPMRRIALWTDLPESSRDLVERFVEKRILIRDDRQWREGASEGQDVVEIALESFLRQWQALAEWLDEEAENLKAADDLVRDAERWQANDRDPMYLYGDRRLKRGEELAATRTFGQKLLPTKEFLLASRGQVSDQQRRNTVRLASLLAATVVVAIVAVIGLVFALHQRHVARLNDRNATAEKLIEGALAILAGTSNRGDDARALQELLAANKLATAPSEVPLLEALTKRASTDLMLTQKGPATGVAYATDGHRLAVADGEHLRVWDTGSPDWLDNLRASNDAVRSGHAPIDQVGCTRSCQLLQEDNNELITSLAISADGRVVATGTGDGTVQVWNLSDPRPAPKVVSHHQGRVSGVALTKDAGRIASGGADGVVELSNLTGADRRDMQTGREVFTVAFNPAGDTLAAGGAGDAIMFWTINQIPPEGGQPDIKLPNAHPGGVMSVAFSPNGDLIASGGVDKTVRLWKTDPLGPLPEFTTLTGKAHTAAVTSVAFDAGGSRLVSGSNDQTVQLWDVAQARRIGDPLVGHQGLVLSVAFVSNGDRDEIVSGGNDQLLRFWNGDIGQPTSAPLIGHQGAVTGVAISANGRRVVSGGVDGNVILWDAATGTKDKQMPSGPVVTRVAMNEAGDVIASGTANGQIRVWRTADDDVTTFDAGGPVSALALDRTGGRMSSAGLDGQITLWELPSGRKMRLRDNDHAIVSDIAFNAQGDRLVSGGMAGIVRVWDLSGHQLWQADVAAKLPKLFRDKISLDAAYPGAILGVAFSPDGERVATASADWPTSSAVGVLQRWRSDTGTPFGDPTSVDLGVMSAAFGSDESDGAGERVVTGSFSPYSVELWNATRGDQFTFLGHQAQVVSVAVSIRRRVIVSGSVDGTVRIWPNPPSKSAADALCDKLTTTMSEDNWRKWVSKSIRPDQHLCPGLPPTPSDNGG